MLSRLKFFEFSLLAICSQLQLDVCVLYIGSRTCLSLFDLSHYCPSSPVAMAPKSDASMEAQRLKDRGLSRHEARYELQKAYGTAISKSRLSQLLTEHWKDKTPAEVKGRAGPMKEDTKVQAESSRKRKSEDQAEETMKPEKVSSKPIPEAATPSSMGSSADNFKPEDGSSDSSKQRVYKRLKCKKKVDY